MTTMGTKLVGAALALMVAASAYEALVARRLSREHQALLAEQARLASERDDALGRLRWASLAPPRLPAPSVPAPPEASGIAGDTDNPAGRVEALIKGEKRRLTPEQIESYLKQNHRTADSLLAIARLTNDKSFLKEAMEKYPDDPRVAFDAVFFGSTSPEERRQWLEQFKEDAPNNAVASYLSALDYFKSGQSDKAVQELLAASSKSQFQDYFWDQVQTAEEAWRSAGYSELDTRVLATSQALLPDLGQLKQLNNSIMDVAKAYRQSGDEASAQAAIEYDLQLGERLAQFPNSPLITQLVGMAIERNALGSLDPSSPYGTAGQTVADQLEQLTRQKDQIRNLNNQLQTLLPSLSTQDFIAMLDRRRMYGELNTIQWLVNKYGQN